MNIWSCWQDLSDLESMVLTKKKKKTFWFVLEHGLPVVIYPQYLSPVVVSRDPMVLGLWLQGSMNITNFPNFPSVVMKPESKQFINVKESLCSCNRYFYIYTYMYTSIPLYVPIYMHTPLSTELWKYIASSYKTWQSAADWVQESFF